MVSFKHNLRGKTSFLSFGVTCTLNITEFSRGRVQDHATKNEIKQHLYQF